MITKMKIEMVPHPRADLRPFANVKFLALSYENVTDDGYCRGVGHLSMDYVEHSLKLALKFKEFTPLEYLEAMSMVKEYKDGLLLRG